MEKISTTVFLAIHSVGLYPNVCSTDLKKLPTKRTGIIDNPSPSAAALHRTLTRAESKGLVTHGGDFCGHCGRKVTTWKLTDKGFSVLSNKGLVKE